MPKRPNSAIAKVVGELVDPSESAKDIASLERWYPAHSLVVEGQFWTDVESPFDRLPAKAKATVRPPVWRLSKHSAGICVRFSTDARSIKIGWSLTSKNLAMPHMPSTGVSGVDLYARQDNGQWRWVANGKPKGQSTTVTFPKISVVKMREYLIYLPLYNGVTGLEVGVHQEAKLFKTKRPAHLQKPLVFYGTSITHGASASRPGMVHTAILGRRFDRPVINLGFSGNGTMDPSISELLTEIDPAVYIIDCLPNMAADKVAARTEPLVHTLRKARPETPILLVEDRSYSNSVFVDSFKRRNSTSRAAFKAAYDKLLSEGVKGLYYLEGDKLLGDDGDGTVDNSHPNDLGFFRQANAFEAVLRDILK